MKKTLTIIAVIAVIAVLSVALLACVPGNIEKATSKMEKAGYKVSSYSDKGAEGCDGGIIVSEGIVPVMYALHFSSSKEAKSYYEDRVGTEKEDKKDAEDSNYKQSGSWVYWGTTAAEKAFEK